jgi:hypothetical protein
MSAISKEIDSIIFQLNHIFGWYNEFDAYYAVKPQGFMATRPYYVIGGANLWIDQLREYEEQTEKYETKLGEMTQDYHDFFDSRLHDIHFFVEVEAELVENRTKYDNVLSGFINECERYGQIDSSTEFDHFLLSHRDLMEYVFVGIKECEHEKHFLGYERELLKWIHLDQDLKNLLRNDQQVALVKRWYIYPDRMWWRRPLDNSL